MLERGARHEHVGPLVRSRWHLSWLGPKIWRELAAVRRRRTSGVCCVVASMFAGIPIVCTWNMAATH